MTRVRKRRKTRNQFEIIGGSTTAWRISMCAPPLADASLDRQF
jgi:hypothetical protein